jgi:hypothetical protein
MKTILTYREAMESKVLAETKKLAFRLIKQ